MTERTHRWACVVGQPVRHSLSPVLHNAAFAAAGLEVHYEAIEVDTAGLPALVRRLREPRCLGANVTAPHKQAILPLLDGLSEEARALGAVNTVIWRDGQLVGDNTDAGGLERWFAEAEIRVGGRDALLLGAGGAARAALVALARSGARSIRVLNRTPDRATRLVADLQPFAPGVELRAGELQEAAAPGGPAAVVLNATSLGHQHASPAVHPAWFSGGAVAVELAYNPPVSPFMLTARAADARAENGLGMLIHQAALAFERWTGLPAPLEAYKRAAERALGAAAPAGAMHS